jgi:hypothetical protein
MLGRNGASLRWVTVGGLLLGCTGCGQLVSRPSSLDYAEPAPQVDVRFAKEPFQLTIVRATPESEQVVAQCQARCRLVVPSGRYLLRARGDAPTAERSFELRHTTRVMVRPGSSMGRVAGIGLIAGGGVASFGLPLAALTGPLADNRHDATPGVLAVVGVSGLAALVTGIVLHRNSRTTIEIEQLDEPVSWK